MKAKEYLFIPLLLFSLGCPACQDGEELLDGDAGFDGGDAPNDGTAPDSGTADGAADGAEAGVDAQDGDPAGDSGDDSGGDADMDAGGDPGGTGTLDMLEWMHSQLPEHTYVAVHAETRAVGSSEWESVTAVYQPFKSRVDADLRQVYWRKDSMKDFYGEVFTYDGDRIYLRMETFPYFSGVDPPGTWDARPDKFRLFVHGDMGDDSRRYGTGRIIAPRVITPGWNGTQTMNAYYCASFDQLVTGACSPYQIGFFDDSVTVELIEPFSTVFDGEIESDANGMSWLADPDFKDFDRAVVIKQSMENRAGRERFFFAARDGVSYGIVRWDNSRLVGEEWFVVDRTMGLKTTQDPQFSFEGIRNRGLQDFYPRKAGLRILSTPGKIQNCPHTMEQRGTFQLPPNGPSTPSHVYDLSGFNTVQGATVTLCADPARADPWLVLPSGCPAPRIRGSMTVQHAEVAVSTADTTRVPVDNDWIVLCAGTDGDWSVTLIRSDFPCPAGAVASGSYVAHPDCYDGMGRRCQDGARWLQLCSE